MAGSFLLMLACVLAFLAAFINPPGPPWYRLPPHLGWLAIAVYFLALALGR